MTDAAVQWRQFRQRIFAAEHRAFWLIVANGVLFQVSDEVTAGRRVVAAFLTEMTGREWMVGLALAVQPLCMSLPQLWASHRISDNRRRMPYYKFGASIRWVAFGLIIAAIVTIPDQRWLLSYVVISMIGLQAFGQGFGSVAFGDILARTVAPRRRGRLFGLRKMLGGALGFCFGFFIRYVLDDDFALAKPYNYALLFGVSLLFLVFCQTFFMRVEEPPLKPRPRPAESFGAYLRQAFALLRSDAGIRSYIAYRVVVPVALMPTAFLVPYVLSELGFGAGVVGLFTSTAVLASAVSNAWWARVSDWQGNRLVLRHGLVLLILSNLLLALTPFFADDWMAAGQTRTLLLWVLVINALGEIALSGTIIGQINYIYELAPRGEVPLYTALLSTSTAPFQMVLPPLFGLAAGTWGYPFVFDVSVIGGLIALAITLVMVEPRDGDGGD